MTSKRNKIRNARESNRKFKKKANPLKGEKIEYIDYKDVALLQRFMSDRSKIRSQRMSGTDVQQQREIANAVKNAREMALLPYTKRVTSTRAPRPGSDRRDDERGPRFRDDERGPRFRDDDRSESTVVDEITETIEATESAESTDTAEVEA